MDSAIRMHDGNCLAGEYCRADLWGIVRPQQVAPVSAEMVLNHITQHSLSLPQSY